MRRNEWFLMDEAKSGEEGGGGVDAATARTFLQDFVHDPEMVKTLPDEKVVEWHGKINAGIDKVRPAGGKWPDAWRDELSAGDEKARARLERFQSPADIFKSYRALEQRMTSGELKPNTPYPDKGTADEQTAWRKDQGIPEAPDKYDLKLPEGMVIGENDKPGVDEFLKKAHAAHMRPEHASAAVAAYMEMREQGIKKTAEHKAELTKSTEDALRGEWGQDYRKNEGLIDGLLAETMASEDLRNDIAEARKLNPDFAKWVLGVALQLNPMGTVLPGSGGTQMQSIQDDLATLDKMQVENPTEFWKEANQQKQRDLLAARDRLEKRAA